MLLPLAGGDPVDEVVDAVEQGAEIVVRMAKVGPDGPTGGYFDRNGPLPW